MAANTPLVLVDGSSYLFRAFHALPDLRTTDGFPTGAIRGVIGMLRKLQADYAGSAIAVVFDASGPTFRHQLYDEYKANRPRMADDLRAQIQPIRDIVQAMGMPLLTVPEVEADDVIGTLAAAATEARQRTVVSTGETWTYDVAATFDAVTEIEGGSYIVMEVPYAYMTEFRFAARVMGRVVERVGESRAIGDVPIDAIGAPNGPPTVEGDAGIVAERIDHHGVVLSVPDGQVPLAVGDTFLLLTHQQDITMNRWERYLGVRDGVVETIIDAPARGCVH